MIDYVEVLVKQKMFLYYFNVAIIKFFLGNNAFSKEQKPLISMEAYGIPLANFCSARFFKEE